MSMMLRNKEVTPIFLNDGRALKTALIGQNVVYKGSSDGENVDTPTELLVTREILDQGIFNNVTPTYLTDQVDGSDGFTIVGRANVSGSSSWNMYGDYLSWIYTIDLTDYNTISFYAKKNADHGSIQVRVFEDCVNGATPLAGMMISYSEVPTAWTKYTIDVSGITGVKEIMFMGGYLDRTGNTSSSTSYCNIKFLK